MQMKIHLKASNLFYPHEIYLRLDSFGREVGIVVYPLEDRESPAIYFRVADWSLFIKYCIAFLADILQHLRKPKRTINRELNRIIEFCKNCKLP